MTNTELLTFAQVAEQLGVDVSIIRRNARAYQIPVVPIGHKVRIPAAWSTTLKAGSARERRPLPPQCHLHHH